MKSVSYFLLAAVLLFCGACDRTHFLRDEAYRAAVEADLAAKREAMPACDRFDFPDGLTLAEREAMDFLYAYMPLGDIADYPFEYHLENYRLAERARREMPWGELLTDELFRHFVLPARVNNENLDDARSVFFDELKGRVAGLSMYDAVLEVNHWCHEKAVYTPSDARTSAPLATVRTASGRCGEESTLLVAALRSVAIPARQVYTPRWAHTDDNHAWVEAWADGRWYFLGACEPEPVLNLGWFNAPASRGMLMHTKVFGRYEGPEDRVVQTPTYTEINVTGNYAATSCLQVRVVDAEKRPVPDAEVEYKLYNYAELYTVARRRSDAEGRSSLTAGRGDLVVWASKEGRFGFVKATVGTDEEVVVALDRREGEPFRCTLDLTPPVGGSGLPVVTPGQRAENDRRMAAEDSVRKAYTASFCDEAGARSFAREHGLEADDAIRLLTGAKGNYAVVSGFLADAVLRGEAGRAVALLRSLSDKDLRDVGREVLDDHFAHTAPDADAAEVLCPRVSYEMLTPWRAPLQDAFAGEADRFRADPELLVEWCRRNILLRPEYAQGIPVSPRGVWRSRCADSRSRDVFFVAAARALGIPARKDRVTGRVYYRKDGREQAVDFETNEAAVVPKGGLRLSYRPIPLLDNPKYYSHFTLSRFAGEGSFRLLDYDERSDWRTEFAAGAALEAGYYLLTTGTRLADGSVLAELTGFEVPEKETVEVGLRLRENPGTIRVIGNFNSELRFLASGADEEESFLQRAGRGYFAVGLLGAGQEPTNHALRDLAAAKEELERWGRSIVLLFGSEEEMAKFDPAEFPGLPSTVTFGVDPRGAVRAEIAAQMNLHGRGALPLFVVADTFNRVVFLSEGYTIGLGERLAQVTGAL